MGKITDRLIHAWNAFTSTEKTPVKTWDMGPSYGGRPDRLRVRISNERSIITSIYVRMAIDAAAVQLRHIRTDENEQYLSDVKSGLNNCLTVEANLDQGASAFRQDIYMSIFESGVIAITPIDTTLDPERTGGYDIQTMRVGTITNWFPEHVLVNVYNQALGKRVDIPLSKKYVGIVENPLYSVMNEQNSTLQRIIRKLNLLDAIDEASASGKLDIIIQLPYVVRGETKTQQANQRLESITDQLKNSSHGIAYADASEKITQLNRPVENRLLEQIEFLLEMLYSQLGITAEVMNGTAEEAVMINYYNRTIEPLLRAVSEEMARKFLTKTARAQMQTIDFFRDPFKLVPMSVLAEIVDKFTRNEVLSSNEVRGVIRMKPSKDPKADELRNSNMPHADDMEAGDDSDLDAIDAALDEAFSALGVTEDVAS